MNNQQHTKHGWRLAAAMTICLASSVAFAAGGSTYKWVDEKGIVHYSDHMPNEALTKGGIVLDKQGRPVQKIEAPLTPEQRSAKAAEEERQLLTRREREDRARRDRALLQSYTTEEDIDIARGRALATIVAQVKSAEIYTEELSRRQEELVKQKLVSNLLTIAEDFNPKLNQLYETAKADGLEVHLYFAFDRWGLRKIPADQIKGLDAKLVVAQRTILDTLAGTKKDRQTNSWPRPPGFCWMGDS